MIPRKFPFSSEQRSPPSRFKKRMAQISALEDDINYKMKRVNITPAPLYSGSEMIIENEIVARPDPQKARLAEYKRLVEKEREKYREAMGDTRVTRCD